RRRRDLRGRAERPDSGARLRGLSHRPGSVRGTKRTVPPITAGPTRARTPTQRLAPDLPVSLPALAIEPEWKAQQRLWGHSFHPMCSYLASFPAALTHAFIARYSRPGDVVLDPFSGRGTTPLQACAEGRIGVGNDLNPFAHLLTASKVQPATRPAATTRLTQLRLAWNGEATTYLGLALRVIADPAGTRIPRAGSGDATDAHEP